MKTLLIWCVVLLFFVGGVCVYMTQMPGESGIAAQAVLTEEENSVAANLTSHCETLGHDIGARGPTLPGPYSDAASYLNTMLRRAGYSVREIPIESKGLFAKNIEATLDGTRKRDEVVLIGANFDSDPRSPGADSNASGCAVLLEVARLLSETQNERSVRFVLFGNGAGTYAGQENSGSWVYAHEAKKRGDKIVAMLDLNCLGNFKDTPGSQSVPFPLNFAYPDTANFVCFASDFGSRELLRKAVGAFRVSSRFPCHGIAMPGGTPGFKAGDHAGFLATGVPSVVVTDTGTWRFEKCGSSFDTVDRLDCKRMARVAVGLVKVVTTLAKSSALL